MKWNFKEKTNWLLLIILALVALLSVAATTYQPVPVSDVEAQAIGPAPATIDLTISGFFPDGCGGRLSAEQQVDNYDISVLLQRQMRSGRACIQVVEPYSYEMTLDGTFEAGTYQIMVNDFGPTTVTVEEGTTVSTTADDVQSEIKRKSAGGGIDDIPPKPGKRCKWKPKKNRWKCKRK